MKMRNEWIIAMVGAAVGLAGLGYALGQRKKLNDISDRLDKSIDELSDTITVNVEDTVVKEAINKAVAREVSIVVPKAVKASVKHVEDDISKQVSDEIHSHFQEIRNDVEQEVHRKVTDIDISALKRDVIAAAKKDAADKLEGSLDDILEDFNRNLKNLSSVYQSMAQTMQGAAGGKEVKLSLG